MTYKLNVNPKAKPMKRPARKYHLDIEEKIKVEVNKLQKVGFIEEIKCSEWLDNIVPVKKKGKQIRICVDFKDHNKAYLKDEFPLPNVDILVNTVSDHECFSSVDDYNNHIFIEPTNIWQCPMSSNRF